jgi:hypothetical protein
MHPGFPFAILASTDSTFNRIHRRRLSFRTGRGDRSAAGAMPYSSEESPGPCAFRGSKRGFIRRAARLPICAARCRTNRKLPVCRPIGNNATWDAYPACRTSGRNDKWRYRKPTCCQRVVVPAMSDPAQAFGIDRRASARPAVRTPVSFPTTCPDPPPCQSSYPAS